MNSRTPYFYVLIGVTLLGTAGAAQAFMPQSIHPLAVGALRLSIGGFILLAALLLMRKISFEKWPWRMTIFAAIFIAIAQYFFFNSMRLTGVAIGTVVAISSAPAFSGIFEWVFFKRKPTRVWLLSTIFAFIGCVLLFVNDDGITVDPRGIGMALAAGLSFALYTIFNKEVLKTTATIPAVAVIFSVSGVLLLPFLTLFEMEGIFTTAGIASILYLGIITVSVAYSLFSMGLRFIPPSSALTLSLLEPLVATLLGVVVVKEQLNLLSWIGVAFLLGGILILTWSKPEAETSPDGKVAS